MYLHDYLLACEISITRIIVLISQIDFHAGSLYTTMAFIIDIGHFPVLCLVILFYVAFNTQVQL